MAQGYPFIRYLLGCFAIGLLISSLSVKAEVAAPTVFIFGDSTADVGTNGFLPESHARADVLFNGIDFRNSKPTGRFSNGFNTVDFIVRLMGYKKSPPPFLSLLNNKMPFFKRNVLQGVNFASGGSGLLIITGERFKKVISMEEQIKQFVTVHSNITEVMGAETDSTISNSFFLISTGSNDIFDYFDSNSTRNMNEFVSHLMNIYEIYLRNLIKLGARKFWLMSVPAIGCCPINRLQSNGTRACLNEMNDYAILFFTYLVGLTQKLTSEIPGLKFSTGNSFVMTLSVIENPYIFGFKEVAQACCGNGILNAENPCSPASTVCRNRKEYVFWDQYHPTQAAAELAARALFTGSPPFVVPVNFSQLTQVYV